MIDSTHKERVKQQQVFLALVLSTLIYKELQKTKNKNKTRTHLMKEKKPQKIIFFKFIIISFNHF